jgi:hypothetical protein
MFSLLLLKPQGAKRKAAQAPSGLASREREDVGSRRALTRSRSRLFNGHSAMMESSSLNARPLAYRPR